MSTEKLAQFGDDRRLAIITYWEHSIVPLVGDGLLSYVLLSLMITFDECF